MSTATQCPYCTKSWCNTTRHMPRMPVRKPVTYTRTDTVVGILALLIIGVVVVLGPWIALYTVGWLLFQL